MQQVLERKQLERMRQALLQVRKQLERMQQEQRQQASVLLQLELERKQPELEQQVQELLLFCRKQPEQQPTEKRSTVFFSWVFLQ